MEYRNNCVVKKIKKLEIGEGVRKKARGQQTGEVSEAYR
jgi:hypothetical protein